MTPAEKLKDQHANRQSSALVTTEATKTISAIHNNLDLMS